MTNFMVMFNYAMVIAMWIATLIFPTDTPQVATASGVDSTLSYISTTMIYTLTLTAGVFALLAFSLLVPTIPFIMLFYSLNAIIASTYIWQLGLPRPNGIPIFEIPFTMGIAIVTFMGIAEYSARQRV